MQSMNVGGKGGHKKAGITFSEINITPLTDIFLVLLIIMMVVAPMMQQSRADIQPPSVAHGTAVDQHKLTVEVTREGAFYLDGQTIPGNGLVEALKGKLDPKAKEKNVIIRADRQTHSGAVIQVMEAARDAGFEKVTVAGESLSKERQNQLESPVTTQEEQGAP